MDKEQLLTAEQSRHTETREYIVQSHMPLGLESPRLNLPTPGVPAQFTLTNEEVEYLRSLVPNIKIIPVVPVEARVVRSDVDVVAPSTSEVVVSVVTVTSKSMNARQAIEYIAAHTKEELEGFLHEEETRLGVKTAWAEKFAEVEATEETPSLEETPSEEKLD
jgi:hypothetical protein